MVNIKPQSVFLPPVKFYFFLRNLSIYLFLLNCPVNCKVSLKFTLTMKQVPYHLVYIFQCAVWSSTLVTATLLVFWHARA